MALRILGDASAAEDAAQDAFVKLIRSARTFRPTGSFRARMTKMVVNSCLDMKRKRARSRARKEVRVAGDKEETHATRKEKEREAFEARELALAGLGDAQRIPIVLHCMQGLTQAEVAGVLQVTNVESVRLEKAALHAQPEIVYNILRNPAEESREPTAAVLGYRSRGDVRRRRRGGRRTGPGGGGREMDQGPQGRR